MKNQDVFDSVHNLMSRHRTRIRYVLLGDAEYKAVRSVWYVEDETAIQSDYPLMIHGVPIIRTKSITNGDIVIR